MRVYIDPDCKCHSVNDGTMRGFELPFFDHKCKAFIEGYRYIPQGESWTRPDGVVFHGEMTAPFVDSRLLEAYQQQYEAVLPELSDAETALEIMGVERDE